MADELEGRANAANNQSEASANEKGIEGRANALLLEEQARAMAAEYEHLATKQNTAKFPSSRLHTK